MIIVLCSDDDTDKVQWKVIYSEINKIFIYCSTFRDISIAIYNMLESNRSLIAKFREVLIHSNFEIYCIDDYFDGYNGKKISYLYQYVVNLLNLNNPFPNEDEFQKVVHNMHSVTKLNE